MKLSINLFDLVKFENLRDENEYIERVTEWIDGMWHININDISEIERLLIKYRIRYRVIR